MSYKRGSVNARSNCYSVNPMVLRVLSSSKAINTAEVLSMRLREILAERILNLVTPSDKQKYADQVWNVLQQSYAHIGGFGTAETPEELINRFHRWKIVVRNGQVTAVKVEKDQYGRKSVGMGSDGTPQGKQDVRMLIKGDVAMNRTWAETSGAPESLYKKYGAVPIPAKYAELLTKHSVISYNPDGFHYTRLFNGHPKEKIIFGFAYLSPKNIETLENNGFSLSELPPNIKLSKG